MTDLGDLTALAPGGGVLGTAVALVGLLWKSNRDDRAEYRATLTAERERHERAAEAWEKEEDRLRDRLTAAEDRRAEAERALKWEQERQALLQRPGSVAP